MNSFWCPPARVVGRITGATMTTTSGACTLGGRSSRHFQVNRGADYDPLVLDDHQTETLEIERTWLCRDAGSRDGCIGGSGRCNAIKPAASFGAASWLPIANWWISPARFTRSVRSFYIRASFPVRKHLPLSTGDQPCLLKSQLTKIFRSNPVRKTPLLLIPESLCSGSFSISWHSGSRSRRP